MSIVAVPPSLVVEWVHPATIVEHEPKGVRLEPLQIRNDGDGTFFTSSSCSARRDGGDQSRRPILWPQITGIMCRPRNSAPCRPPWGAPRLALGLDPLASDGNLRRVEIGR